MTHNKTHTRYDTHYSHNKTHTRYDTDTHKKTQTRFNTTHTTRHTIGTTHEDNR